MCNPRKDLSIHVTIVCFNKILAFLWLRAKFIVSFWITITSKVGNRGTVKKYTLFKMRPRKMKCSDFFSRPSKDACKNLWLFQGASYWGVTTFLGNRLFHIWGLCIFLWFILWHIIVVYTHTQRIIFACAVGQPKNKVGQEVSVQSTMTISIG